MANSINKFSEIQAEKERLATLADDQYKKVKESINTVREEGKSVMVKKILIPAGIAVVAGYGLKKVIDYLTDHEDSGTDRSASRHTRQTEHARTAGSSDHGGFLSGINWSSLALQLVPFIVSVGKKMYEEGNLPYFNHPDDTANGGDL